MRNSVMVKGYQWGDDDRFIGPYEFEQAMDREPVHLPPRTTMIEPPAVAADEEAAWNGRAWIVRRATMSHLEDRVVSP